MVTNYMGHQSSAPQRCLDKGAKLAGICGFLEPQSAGVLTTCSKQHGFEARGVGLALVRGLLYCLMINPCSLEHE